MRYLICILFLALCHHATYAQKIYKWTDENGKTHYGDKPAVKGKNKVMIMNKKKSPTTKPLSSGDEEKVLDEEALSASEANVSKCLAIAREAAALPESAHAERKNLFKELQFFCPNKVYDCTSYRVNPDDVICKASTKKPGDNFFTNRSLGSGKAPVRKPVKRQKRNKELMI